MAKIKVELNRKGVRELLKSAEAAAACDAKAQQIANALGDDYSVERRSYPERTGAAVVASTPKAIKDELENKTLLRALDTFKD